MHCIEHDGKEYYISTKEHFEDYLREVCGEEAFEAYNDLVIGDIENLKEELEEVINAKEEWGRIADGYNRHLIDTMEICGEIRDYISSSSRLNRKKILSYIKEIENEVE